MLDSYTKIFNCNGIILFTIYMIGITAAEIYNYFFKIEYTYVYLFVCIGICIVSYILGVHQLKKYNKDV